MMASLVSALIFSLLMGPAFSLPQEGVPDALRKRQIVENPKTFMPVSALPDPATVPSTTGADGRVRIRTSYLEYVDCKTDKDNNQAGILKQSLVDAITLAEAGLDYVNDELVSTKTFPRYAHRQVDFSKQAAIDYFGPVSRNAAYQQHIFG